MAPKKKSGGGNPRDQYFTAIKQQKLDTLRWCLRHGGVTHRSEDEEGHTGLMVAAAGGFSDSLGKLIEQVLKIGPPEDMDDVDEDGRTPLMMAAYNGAGRPPTLWLRRLARALAWPGLSKPRASRRCRHAGKLDCVKLLVIQGKCNVKIKDEKGVDARGCVPKGSTLHALQAYLTSALTTHTKLARALTLRRHRVARSYAALRKNDKIMAFLDNPKAATPDSEEDDDDEEKPKARVFKASQQVGGTAAWTRVGVRGWGGGGGGSYMRGHRLNSRLGFGSHGLRGVAAGACRQAAGGGVCGTVHHALHRVCRRWASLRRRRSRRRRTPPRWRRPRLSRRSCSLRPSLRGPRWPGLAAPLTLTLALAPNQP
jgi:hypothetical protein